MFGISLVWIIVGSVVFFIVGLLGALATVVWMPADYFVRPHGRHRGGNPVVRLVVIVLRNVLGVPIIVAGVVMLFTPGQGLLTILIGLMLVTFPGKHRLIRLIVARPAMINAMNALRARFNKPPLEIEMSGESDTVQSQAEKPDN